MEKVIILETLLNAGTDIRTKVTPVYAAIPKVFANLIAETITVWRRFPADPITGSIEFLKVREIAVRSFIPFRCIPGTTTGH